MKVTVVKEFRFEAAHRLPFHEGACQRLHGHSYKLQIGVEGELGVAGPETGMVIDFSNLKRIVNEQIIAELDHQCLNEIAPVCYSGELIWPANTPTAESMVLWIAQRLIAYLPVKFVRLWETETSYAEVVL